MPFISRRHVDSSRLPDDVRLQVQSGLPREASEEACSGDGLELMDIIRLCWAIWKRAIDR